MGAYRDYYLPQVFLIVAHKARRTLAAVNKKSGESSSNKDQDTTSMGQQKGGWRIRKEKILYSTRRLIGNIVSRGQRESRKTRMEYGTKIHTEGLTPDKTCIN